MFSAVERLTLAYEAGGQSSPEHNEVDLRTGWCRILRSFSNVETLHVEDGLEEEIARRLRLEDDAGELPLDLLPELHELTYSRRGHTDDDFTSFINARRNAGRLITLVDL
jgi:hypothetical protein